MLKYYDNNFYKVDNNEIVVEMLFYFKYNYLFWVFFCYFIYDVNIFFRVKMCCIFNIV